MCFRLFQVLRRETHIIFTQAAWTCLETEEEEEEESPASEGAVDGNPHDQLSPPHTRGTTYTGVG